MDLCTLLGPSRWNCAAERRNAQGVPVGDMDFSTMLNAYRHPNTPCMPYLPISWGGARGGLSGAAVRPGSPMVCLGQEGLNSQASKHRPPKPLRLKPLGVFQRPTPAKASVGVAPRRAWPGEAWRRGCNSCYRMKGAWQASVQKKRHGQPANVVCAKIGSSQIRPLEEGT